MGRRYDHVVFDLDGTLIDSAADIAAAANHVRGLFGEPALDVASVWRHVGKGVRALLVGVLPRRSAAEIDRAVAAYRAHYQSHLLERTRPFAGIEALLADLRAAGVSLSVLTNKPAAAAEAILRGLEMHACFAVVLGGDSLPQPKPDAAGVLEIQRRMGLAPPRLLLVGDSLVDRDTARAARIDFCAATWGAPAPTLAGERLQARRPADVLAFVT